MQFQCVTLAICGSYGFVIKTSVSSNENRTGWIICTSLATLGDAIAMLMGSWMFFYNPFTSATSDATNIYLVCLFIICPVVLCLSSIGGIIIYWIFTDVMIIRLILSSISLCSYLVVLLFIMGRRIKSKIPSHPLTQRIELH